jgi:hypothetical protein
VCYDQGVGARDDQVKHADHDAAFDRAKMPMVISAVGVAVGLAIAGSVERTTGGAVVLGAWVLGIGALHRLGRAGSVRREGPAPQSASDGPDAEPR